MVLWYCGRLTADCWLADRLTCCVSGLWFVVCARWLVGWLVGCGLCDKVKVWIWSGVGLDVGGYVACRGDPDGWRKSKMGGKL
jgi:hypothetical protein